MAALVALAARRLHLPYSVGLVLTGVSLAVLRVDVGVALTPTLIFDALLPPLLFEAALSLHWPELRRDALPVLVLSTVGVAVAAILVAWGMTRFAHWPAPSALVFGVLIAATDPVSVLATFKETGVKGRLRLLVEAESLFNDGVAATLFLLALGYAMTVGGPVMTPAHAAVLLVSTMLGGIAVGLAGGGLAIALAGRTSDHLVETTLTAVAAYGSFLLADSLHFSGVLATVTAGLLMGNLGILRSDEPSNLSQRGREVVLAFWDFAAFVANSLIFLLIGLGVAHISFRTLGLPALLLAVALTLAGRALAVYPLCALFARSRLRISAPHQLVLFWGGLRGALGLALALSLPRALPFHDQIVIAAFGVVAFSVVGQGVTMPLLLYRLGLLPKKG